MTVTREPGSAEVRNEVGRSQAVNRAPRSLWRRLVAGRTPRLVGLGLIALILFTPVFRYNALGAADTQTFGSWQLDSQALVAAKIESTTPAAKARGINALGLLVANPDQNAPNGTLDWLTAGAQPTTTRYAPYQSQIGFPGYFFTALYHLGLTTTSGLQVVSSALFVGVLGLFAFLLGRATRTSFAVVFVLATLGSPWLALAGRNLYWVPWTWFLPAVAALWFCRSRGRMRYISLAAMAGAFMLKWASGYEFLTSITLLAAAMPVLSAVFASRREWPVRRAVRDVLIIIGVAVVCFAVSVVILAFLVGAGDFAYGANIILFDAGKRTYGGVAVTDPLLAASIAANPLDVVATYLFGWNTNVLSLGSGTPVTLVLGANSLWMLVVGAVVVVVARALRRDRLWIRDCWILGIALVIPLSWFVAGKAHSYVHPFIDFVIWYLITVSALIWIVGAYTIPRARALGSRVFDAAIRRSRLIS